MAAWHIFRDPVLLARVRSELDEHLGPHTTNNNNNGIDLQKLLKIPLLLSIYAETLRLYIKTYVIVSSQTTDVDLGRWRLPRGTMGLLNSTISHRDAEFWNTNGPDGTHHPVDTFWADRFLVDPRDAFSGPINPAMRDQVGEGRGRFGGEKLKDGKPFFFTEGLKASWFPYGGMFSSFSAFLS